MKISLEDVFREYMSEDFAGYTKLLAEQDPKSEIIEIIGYTGAGKYLLLEHLEEQLKKQKQDFFCYHPKVFSWNQLRDLVLAVSNLKESEYETIVRQAVKYEITRDYDFFYYLTETINKENYFKSISLIIMDGDFLTDNSRKFIQYLVQYAEDYGIKIFVFTRDHKFNISHVERQHQLSIQGITRIIKRIFPEKKSDFIFESEILWNITQGNLLTLEHILIDILLSAEYSKGKSFDLLKYIEEKTQNTDFYEVFLDELTDSQKQLLSYIFLLDGKLSHEKISILPDLNEFKDDLECLQTKSFIREYDSRYNVISPRHFQQWFQKQASEKRNGLISIIVELFKKEKVRVSELSNYLLLLDSYDNSIFSETQNELKNICNYENLLEILEYSLKKTKKAEKRLEILTEIGKTYQNLNMHQEAANTFRNCLQLSTEKDLPNQQVVYLLAQNLFALNSSNFALEIIKKYSYAELEHAMKAKMMILKAEILTEKEDFGNAMPELDRAQQYAFKIEDDILRYRILGNSHKAKGKIYYYSNDWDHAEACFKDAKSFFEQGNEISGLAAIYNNLAVIPMFRGNWDESEALFLRSLDIEKSRYNLNGMSVCYNNLGGLMDDKGDKEKSIFYLYQGLNIQKLLSDPYNITNIYNNIGVTHMDNNEFEKAEDAFNKSLETAINFSFHRNTIATLNNIGALFFQQGKWNEAIDTYERAIEKSEETDFVDGLIRSYINLGELYEKRGELNIAYDLYFKGLELLPQVNDDYIKAQIYGNLGSTLTKMHKFKEAYRYLVESFDFFKSLDAKNEIIEGCQKQAFYFIITMNYESADYYLKMSNDLAIEINNTFEVGKTLLLRAQLERKDLVKAKAHLEKAVEIFGTHNKIYELAEANYELANIVAEMGDSEEALNILQRNKSIIKNFGSIRILEQNDLLYEKINKEYKKKVDEAKYQESILDKFYAISETLNEVHDFDLLLNTAIDEIINIAEADGGILCLYNSENLPESWEYKLFRNFSFKDSAYEYFMELILESLRDKSRLSFKQPNRAKQFNHVITFPMSMRNQALGVVLLFSNHESYYFNDQINNLLNALTNQIIVSVENIRATNLEKTHEIIREELNSSNIFANIIGKHQSMLAIFDIIRKIKDTPTTVLLEGPSGTGKELIARAIHYSSNRKNKAFVAQYCGALPETLLESELFGHVKGSFTGAAYDKKGLFEIADGGTFFLDEIADISLSTQAKLLRFLQEGEVKRVGAVKTERVNVRVVCATNVSLKKKVEEGDFRLDLYYRLNVIRIEVPSLKERASDIPLLAIHFLDKFNKRINKEIKGFTDEAMKYLMSYSFPGNVRQLENEIERAVTLADDESYIKPQDFSEEIFRFAENTKAVSMLTQNANLKEAVEQLEKDMIMHALEATAWNQTKAAKHLGLSRQGLIKKMRRYELYQDDMFDEEDDEDDEQ
ncbi:MAG: sigma 54-interacting transcriptional regulator [Candidatus Cloacimonetes bacterium]|nr:sigma 54-interacting transcriptional regulator [Candidatus Cloacimonadota bacterium]